MVIFPGDNDDKYELNIFRSLFLLEGFFRIILFLIYSWISVFGVKSGYFGILGEDIFVIGNSINQCIFEINFNIQKVFIIIEI